MIHNEIFFKNKIISELNSHRGVRIGESSIVSTKLHLFNTGKGEVIIVKSKDLGNSLYGQESAGSYVHIDTFHSGGNVNCSEILKRLKEIFVQGVEIVVQDKESNGAIAGNGKDLFLRNSFTNRSHVHIAIKIRPDMYEKIIPAVCTIEECILSEGLSLKKIKKFRCRRYRIFSSFLIFKSPKDKFSGEYSDTPIRMKRGGMDISALVGGGLFSKNNGIDKIENTDKIQKVIRYLKKNSCLLKEEAEGDKDENSKIFIPYHKDDWIENIDISGTVVSLLKKRYWINQDSEIEDRDIKVYRGAVKDYRNTIFIIDNSQSMRGDNIESVKRMVIEICRKLKGGAAIVTFSSKNAYLYSKFTNNKESIRKLIDKIEIQEVTPLAHGLNVAYEYAARSLKKNINIVLLTDGEPNVPFKSDCPLTDCIEVSALIKKKGFNLCCICTTDETSAVDKIIEAAKGKTFNINSFKM